MKNIEWISNWKNFKLSPKLEFITRETNQLLRSNLEDKEIMKNIKTNFNKLVRFSKYFINKIKNEKDFEEFLVWLEIILKDLKIEKLHNTTTIKNIKNFSKLNLLQQFFYISIPIYNKWQTPDFIKWWICYNWALFFYNLFEQIDKNNKLTKNLVLFTPEYNHWAFIVWFKNRKFLIDPYAKSNWLITEIKEWNKIYLWAILKELIFWEIIDKNNLKLKAEWKTFSPKIYKTKLNFIKNIKSKSILEIKTYIEGKATQLSIKDMSENSVLIFLNWKPFEREKIFVKDDIMNIYMEKSFSTRLEEKYKLLLAILWFHDEFLNSETKKQLKAIAGKINEEYIFEKFWLKEDIEMFKQIGF